MSILRMMVTLPIDKKDPFGEERDIGLVVFDSEYEPFKNNMWGKFGLESESKESRKAFNLLTELVLEVCEEKERIL